MKQFLLIFTFLTLSNLSFGQNPENEQIRIKIDANIDGEKVKIDTSIDALSDFDIDGLLKSLGLDEELSQLNIDINTGFNFYWDEAAFEEMMEGLKNIEIPEIPEIPMIPDLEHLQELEMLSSNKALLGVYTDKVPEGAKITGLVEESGAITAGLKEGDIITSIDARTIESPDNLSEVIGMYEVGATVKVTYIREGKTQTINVVLTENKNKFGSWSGMEGFNFEDSFNVKWDNDLDQLMELNIPKRGYLGVYLKDEDGVVKVSGVEDNSAAKEAGLQEGDIITELNGNKIITYDEVMEFMENTTPGEKIKITYEREGKKNTVDATLKEVKNMNFYFKDNEEGFAPNIIIDRIAPCPPGSAYSYNSGDGKRNINICITAIKNTDKKAPSPNGNSSELNHPLLDQKSVSIYSNPSEGAFNVKFNLPETGDTKIVITDINGKEVYSETFLNFSGAFDKTITLTTEPKGTYFVKVSQNGYSNTKTVVLQ